MISFSAWLDQQPPGSFKSSEEITKTYDALVTTDTHIVGEVNFEKLVSEKGAKVLEVSFTSSSAEYSNKYESVSILTCAILNRTKITNFDSFVLKLLGFGVSVDNRENVFETNLTPLQLLAMSFKSVYYSGRAPLKMTAQTIDKFVSASKSINARDENGRTALYSILSSFPAIDGNAWDFANSLLARGADPFVVNIEGETIEEVLIREASIDNSYGREAKKNLPLFRECLKTYNVNVNVDLNRMTKYLPDLAAAIKSEAKALRRRVDRPDYFDGIAGKNQGNWVRTQAVATEERRERLITKIERFVDWSKQTGTKFNAYFSTKEWVDVYETFTKNIYGNSLTPSPNVTKIFEGIPCDPEPQPVYPSYGFGSYSSFRPYSQSFGGFGNF